MDEEKDHKPWFGGKRAGFGIQPQTWQGWVITLVVVVVIVGGIYLLRH